ncbi:hypothetical protein L596_017157 [Steinernema carpocapsae]|uniref:Uncharacterized protein n=1 Tax=Steinernema carpocapsae TaxID=34508 RepID=A0A4U5N121_STECR|nr:hypothetical protein L596_017157 [Steinernema carpocapsae]
MVIRKFLQLVTNMKTTTETQQHNQQSVEVHSILWTFTQWSSPQLANSQHNEVTLGRLALCHAPSMGRNLENE